MQRDTTTSNDEQTNEPDWVLASYGQRVGAWALDFVGFVLPLILLIVGVVVFVLALLLDSEEPEGIAYVASAIAFVLLGTIGIVVVGTLAIVIIGYIVWWLFALGRGQTPGKQIVGIRVIKDDGTPSDWGYTFLREFVVKFFFLGLLSQVTIGIAWLVDYLWPLWDREKKMQTLHDKLLGTLVVRNPR